jgi:hypothetical protein
MVGVELLASALIAVPRKLYMCSRWILGLHQSTSPTQWMGASQ